MTALSRESKRVLALFGKTPKKVVPSVGDEQEYFLIKKDAYRKRRDLVITGRIMDCTARFFVNPGAARLDPRVRNLADRLAAAVKDKHFEPVAGSAQ